MPGKPKTFLKQESHAKKKKKETAPDNADEFLEAGVDFEDAAGKWRAGDAAKSMRFFQRAIEAYEQGLQKFPNSFDLAYNKARVQLEVATHPVLATQLNIPLLPFLQETLKSHEAALRLDAENADTLFNTSQVLTSIAEEMAKDDELPDRDAIHALHEAVHLQIKCYSIQMRGYEESKTRQQLMTQEMAEDQTMQNEPGDVVANTDNHSSSARTETEDQWFSIVEPITEETLMDTLLAEVATLTTMCGILVDHAEMADSTSKWIQEQWMDTRVRAMVVLRLKTLPEKESELSAATVAFLSAKNDLFYRWGVFDLNQYNNQLPSILSTDPVRPGDRDTHVSLIAKGRALMTFNSAVAERQPGDAAASLARWNALTTAISKFATASTIQGVDRETLSLTHALRGDVSLCLEAMAYAPTSHPAAIERAKHLAKNAEVYYRNALKLAPQPQDEEEKDVLQFRGAVAAWLQAKTDGSADALTFMDGARRGWQWAEKELETMVDEGMVAQSAIQ